MTLIRFQKVTKDEKVSRLRLTVYLPRLLDMLGMLSGTTNGLYVGTESIGNETVGIFSTTDDFPRCRKDRGA